ncbi:MAG: class I SAM-dependent methyltransferase [Oryzihumus sp.]
MDGESKTLLERWRAEQERPVSGWDLGELQGRYGDEQPPWSWDHLARVALAGATSALDMGTGGGEVLSRLADALPGDTVATEGWPPNLPVATAALAPWGIPVTPYDAETDTSMPFPDRRFDVVLNRHEAYDAAEVARVLAPGGRFLTQQVDGRNFDETRGIFGHVSAYPHVRLEVFRADLGAAGLVVEDAEAWQGSAWFADVAAFVRYLTWVPWEAPPDFSVDRYSDDLLRLHATVVAGRELTFTRRSFRLLARRP